MNVATHRLTSLQRIIDQDLGRTPAAQNGVQLLLLPEGIDIEYLPDDNVRTTGLGDLDRTMQELVSIVAVDDALAAIFHEVGIVSPRTYVDSRPEPPTHVVAQGLIYFMWSRECSRIVSQLQLQYDYGTDDPVWRGFSAWDQLAVGTVCLLMNRRIGGWDGSPDRPVVELLAGGGHVKTFWDARAERFRMASIEETLLAELSEELGFQAQASHLHRLGGFINQSTKELVVLSGLEVAPDDIPAIQAAAYGNVEENINGLYIGPFAEIMAQYLQDARPYAGGEKAKKSNFPSDRALMARINDRFSTSR